MCIILSERKTKLWIGKEDPCRRKPIIPDKIGTPEEVMKSLHFHIDWIRAVIARKTDQRQFSNLAVENLLLKIQEGMPLSDEGWDWHFNGD